MNEFEFIDKFFRPLTNKIAGNLKNDAAIFKQKSSYDLIISTDTLVEGIHFFGNEDPNVIAKKSLRVNLSDMAAMGAKPLFYNLSLSLPKKKAKYFIPRFAEGLKEDQDIFNLQLIGGDLTSSLKHINITLTIFGETTNGESVPRDASRLGDDLFVSGVMGLAKIGLDNFNSNEKELSPAKTKYLLPEPRVILGSLLRKNVNSMIDISDGLVQDAIHLSKNANLCIELNLECLPLPNLKSIQNKVILNSALYGGDDYELLFSCDPKMENNLRKISKKLNIPLTKIGVFKEFRGKHLKFKNNKSILKKSYLHF